MFYKNYLRFNCFQKLACDQDTNNPKHFKMTTTIIYIIFFVNTYIYYDYIIINKDKLCTGGGYTSPLVEPSLKPPYVWQSFCLQPWLLIKLNDNASILMGDK